MSLKNYCVKNDHFIFDGSLYSSAFDFPCCVCNFQTTEYEKEPCKSCGHSIYNFRCNVKNKKEKTIDE